MTRFHNPFKTTLRAQTTKESRPVSHPQHELSHDAYEDLDLES